MLSKPYFQFLILFCGISFLLLYFYSYAESKEISLVAGEGLQIKSLDIGCKNWSNSCKGFKFKNLYPGWKNAIQVSLKNNSQDGVNLRILPVIKKKKGSELLFENTYLEIVNEKGFSTGRHSLKEWERNQNRYLSPLIPASTVENWELRFEISPQLGNEAQDKFLSFDLIFEGVESFEEL